MPRESQPRVLPSKVIATVTILIALAASLSLFAVEFKQHVPMKIVNNEKSAQAILQMYFVGQLSYRFLNSKGFSSSLKMLGEKKCAGIPCIDASIADGVENGYRFSLKPTKRKGNMAGGFEIYATPIEYGKSGLRSFFIDETGVIRAADHNGRKASRADSLDKEAMSNFWLLIDESGVTRR